VNSHAQAEEKGDLFLMETVQAAMVVRITS